MFLNATAFNQDINTKQVTRDGNEYTAWDVSAVRDMAVVRQLVGCMFFKHSNLAFNLIVK